MSEPQKPDPKKKDVRDLTPDKDAKADEGAMAATSVHLAEPNTTNCNLIEPRRGQSTAWHETTRNSAEK
jgi:hypothetical protein